MTFCNNNKIDTMIRQLLSPSHSYFSFGIICGRLWGSFAVHFGDHLRLGIICSTVQKSSVKRTEFFAQKYEENKLCL